VVDFKENRKQKKKIKKGSDGKKGGGGPCLVLGVGAVDVQARVGEDGLEELQAVGGEGVFNVAHAEIVSPVDVERGTVIGVDLVVQKRKKNDDYDDYDDSSE
jgi:hypothetical protein